MRSALRGTEVIPPADGWARLERELGPHPRISVLRSHWPRIAAAAAAVLIFLGGGGYLLHENRDLGDKGFVIATATDSGSSAADMAQVDGTPAGDGEGTLAGRSAQPFRPKRPCGLRRCRARSRCGDGSRDCTGTECPCRRRYAGLRGRPCSGFDVRSCARRGGGCCKRRHR